MEKKFPKNQKKLRSALQKELKKPVALMITDNTHIFLNAALRGGIWRVRLHWMFLKARLDVWRHIARYIVTHSRDSSKVIDGYIEKRWDWVRHPLPPIRTKGKIYDLEKIFNRLNRHYFRGKIKTRITWGQSVSRKAYEQIQLGSFSTSRQLITIHPHLDQKFVPKYVVEGCVFHEMCHAALPVQTVNGRKQLHSPAFKKMEARFPQLEKAMKWEEKNINHLLRRPR